jgi:hypothetical protein
MAVGSADSLCALSPFRGAHRTTCDESPKISDSADQAFFQWNNGCPRKEFASSPNIGTATRRIIGWKRLEKKWGFRANQTGDLASENVYAYFTWVAEVDRTGIRVDGHEANEPINEITHIAERPCARTVAVNGDGLAS